MKNRKHPAIYTYSLVTLLAITAGLLNRFIPNSDWAQTILACAAALYIYNLIEGKQ